MRNNLTGKQVAAIEHIAAITRKGFAGYRLENPADFYSIIKESDDICHNGNKIRIQLKKDSARAEFLDKENLVLHTIIVPTETLTEDIIIFKQTFMEVMDARNKVKKEMEFKKEFDKMSDFLSSF